MALNSAELIKLNIPELIETEAFYDDVENVLYVYCEAANEYTGPCTKCGCFNYHKHGHSVRRRIHDISFGDKSVDIMLKQTRYKCQEEGCGETFYQPFEFADPGTWMTKRLIEVIAKEALLHPFTYPAAKYGVTIPTVAKIMTDYGRKLDTERIITAPRVLGIDEVHINGKMRGVFIDAERNTLLQMTPSQKKDVMADAIVNMKDYYENIKIVTMDMANGYKRIVEDNLPDALIVIDKFHVVRYIYSAADAAKKILQKELRDQVSALPPGPDKARKEDLLMDMVKDTYLFKYSTKNIARKPRRYKLMSDLCKEFPEINELRLTKVYAEAIYESEDALKATENMHRFLDYCPKGEAYAEFRRFGRMIVKWAPEIMNYFHTGKQYTNAATEGINSFIKNISRTGRGYTFEALRIKCLHHPKLRSSHNLKSRKKPTTPYSEYIWSSDNNPVKGDKSQYEYDTSIALLNDFWSEIF